MISSRLALTACLIVGVAAATQAAEINLNRRINIGELLEEVSEVPAVAAPGPYDRFVKPIMAAWRATPKRAPRGEAAPDYSFANSQRYESAELSGKDIPQPGRNMPHFRFDALLSWYAQFGKHFDLERYLTDTIDVLWHASRPFGSAIDWDKVTFVFGGGPKGSAWVHGGRQSQTITWTIPYGSEKAGWYSGDRRNLIHEMAHVFQYQKGQLTMLGYAFGEGIDRILGKEQYNYGGSRGLKERIADHKRTDLSQLDVEEAAEIIRNYVELKQCHDKGDIEFTGTAMAMDPDIKSKSEAEEYFKRLEHYASQVLPSPGSPVKK